MLDRLVASYHHSLHSLEDLYMNFHQKFDMTNILHILIHSTFHYQNQVLSMNLLLDIHRQYINRVLLIHYHIAHLRKDHLR
jgi:hypothetical protein